MSFAFPELNLSSCDLPILEVPSKPNYFPCSYIQTIHLTKCHVLGFQEMSLFLEPFNRSLLGQKYQ